MLVLQVEYLVALHVREDWQRVSAAITLQGHVLTFLVTDGQHFALAFADFDAGCGLDGEIISAK